MNQSQSNAVSNGKNHTISQGTRKKLINTITLIKVNKIAQNPNYNITVSKITHCPVK